MAKMRKVMFYLLVLAISVLALTFKSGCFSEETVRLPTRRVVLEEYGCVAICGQGYVSDKLLPNAVKLYIAQQCVMKDDLYWQYGIINQETWNAAVQAELEYFQTTPYEEDVSCEEIDLNCEPDDEHCEDEQILLKKGYCNPADYA